MENTDEIKLKMNKLIEFWKNAPDDIKDKNFNIFIDLIKYYNDEEYSIYKLFEQTDSNIIKKHSTELVNILEDEKQPYYLVNHIWRSIDEKYQNKELLLKLIKVYDTEELNFEIKILKNTCKKLQKEVGLSKILKVTTNKQIYRGIKYELSEDEFKEIINSSNYDIKYYETYKELFKNNENINSTMELGIFNIKFLEIFDIEKLVRITNYAEIQKNMIKLGNVQGSDIIFNTICNDSNNWIMELDYVVKNFKNFPELMQDISKESIDQKDAKMIIQVLSQKENYFNISNISDARNYFNIRKDICQKILNDEEIENLNPVISNYSNENRKRFAILELMYGIDLEEAENLIQKYGKDIEKTGAYKNGDKTALELVGIKRILECKNISEKYNTYKNEIDNELETIEYSSVATLETNCINMYEDIYAETLYKPKEEDKVSFIEYEGKKIEVYEINEDFNMFIRAEGTGKGGYNYEEPENFADELDSSVEESHGSCRSFISQELISILDSEGPKFGYSKCDKGSLFLVAPWDIMSNGANEQFSTASAKWDFECGIQYRIPTEMINNTRDEYSEFVFEKFVYNKDTKKFNKDKPDYVVYVQEPNIDRQQDEQWRITKKAASQLGIPIVVIDREKFAKRELQKIEDLEAVFLGKVENKENIPETELLEKIIVKFENNATGIQTSRTLYNKYFTNEQGSNMIGRLWGKIKELDNTNFEKYIELVDKFVEVLKNEETKIKTNTGKEVSKSKFNNILNALRKKQKEAKDKILKENLAKKYKEFNVDTEDLSKSKGSLKNEKEKEQEKNGQNQTH